MLLWRRSAPKTRRTARDRPSRKTGKTQGLGSRSNRSKVHATYSHFGKAATMSFWLVLIGLGLNFTGAVIIALVDAWFSRALLVYLDALESNLGLAVQELHRGGTKFVPTKVDLLRDRNQN